MRQPLSFSGNYEKISRAVLQFSGSLVYLCGVPGDQLLQNLPRAEMQQGYVVVAVCPAYFLLMWPNFKCGQCGQFDKCGQILNVVNVVNLINVVNVFDICLGAPH